MIKFKTLTVLSMLLIASSASWAMKNDDNSSGMSQYVVYTPTFCIEKDEIEKNMYLRYKGAEEGVAKKIKAILEGKLDRVTIVKRVGNIVNIILEPDNLRDAIKIYGSCSSKTAKERIRLRDLAVRAVNNNKNEDLVLLDLIYNAHEKYTPSEMWKAILELEKKQEEDEIAGQKNTCNIF